MSTSLSASGAGGCVDACDAAGPQGGLPQALADRARHVWVAEITRVCWQASAEVGAGVERVEWSAQELRICLSSPRGQDAVLRALRSVGYRVRAEADVASDRRHWCVVAGWDLNARIEFLRQLVVELERVTGECAARAVRRYRRRMASERKSRLAVAWSVRHDIRRHVVEGPGRHPTQDWPEIGAEDRGPARDGMPELAHDVALGDQAVMWLSGAAVLAGESAVELFRALWNNGAVDADVAAAQTVDMIRETVGRGAVLGTHLVRAGGQAPTVVATGRSFLWDLDLVFDVAGSPMTLSSEQLLDGLVLCSPVYRGWSVRDVDDAVCRLGMAEIGLRGRQLAGDGLLEYWCDDVVRACRVAAWVERAREAAPDGASV